MHDLRRVAAVAMSMGFLSAAPVARANAQNQAAIAAHVDSARALAGTDVSPAIMKVLCSDPRDVAAFLRPIMASSKPMPPTRAFDDLYYLGLDFVGSWALNTTDGIIFFDALDNAKEVREIVEPGLRTLGLDPARIKYVVVMHGHGDHYGGAKYLQDKYHAQVLMSAADWDFAPKWLVAYTAAAGKTLADNFGPIPARDGVIADGQRLTLGGTTVTFYITPGHTPGTLSAIVPVKDGGVPHVLSFWGGTALPSDLPGRHQYRQSLERFMAIVDTSNVDGVISNHPFIDGTSDKVTKIRTRQPGEPNPFVIGAPAVRRYMGVHLQCARAAELR